MADKHGHMLVVVKVRNEDINTVHLDTERGEEREREGKNTKSEYKHDFPRLTQSPRMQH